MPSVVESQGDTMKLLFAFFLLVFSSSSAMADTSGSSTFAYIAQSFSSAASSLTPLPEAKGRKGSKRVGGYTKKGKGSRYVGGRK